VRELWSFNKKKVSVRYAQPVIIQQFIDSSFDKTFPLHTAHGMEKRPTRKSNSKQSSGAETHAGSHTSGAKEKIHSLSFRHSPIRCAHFLNPAVAPAVILNPFSTFVFPCSYLFMVFVDPHSN
jgi:hypothetical protein